MNGNICVLGQTVTLPVIKNARPMPVAPFIGGTNLCKEIIIPMFTQLPSKYKFSRDWYVAEFNVKDFTDVVHWCREHFGPHPRHPDAWSRWKHTYENKIHFRDEQDYMWFLLRWS